MLRRVLLPFVSLFCMGLTCGWGVPLDGLSTHCPPRTIDCGPGCIEETATCCDDTLGGGLSQCQASGMMPKACVARGTGSCASGGAGRFCCGEPSLAGATPSTDISSRFSGEFGVFCGTNVIEAGTECCSAVDGKRICRITSTRLYAGSTGTGGGGTGGGGVGGGGVGGGVGGGGGAPTCSTSGPGFNGSGRWCGQLSALCNCSTDSTNRCITKKEFDAVGKPYPGQCKPSGGTGCFDSASQFVIAPCCAGLTCRVSTVCGSSAAGGTCMQ